MITEMRKAHKGPNVMNGSNGEAVSAASGVYADDAAKERAIHRMWGGDHRLALFGYTVETMSMLLLPMVQTKWVVTWFVATRLVNNVLYWK